MHPLITGNTRIYGLIGDPLRSAKSPMLLNRLFAEAQTDAVCIPMEVGTQGLAEFVKGARAVRNLAGLLVTMPHKQTMLEMVDMLHPTAREVGAINVVRCDPDGRWEGAVFDGLGCVLGMQRKGVSLHGKSVLLVGAGGSGRAIAIAIAAAGARSLIISDLDPQRATDLAQRAGEQGSCTVHAGPADPAGHDIVINATPLGMNPDDPMPIEAERLNPATTVVDIITRAEPTALLLEARARGCKTLDGQPMHVGQALLALRFLGFKEIEHRYSTGL
ncbi:shikimate dehydrogenase [Pseudomonas sp. MAFF212428]|uniref:shikimate dehydrogenase (NADP(+)) n=1 Tax=Pseudomonas brassicae TaxID=2708063 RepID=A0A6B3P1K2_9PSED|nr:shikimate dehydrogenase [Pseudomonas brassicae]NER60129.1 shikimate dehydrogenase [Pseudomonas brassicae]NER65634.1 shikimate dehydrogenase [Pseudomonas brassicae]